MKDKEINKLLVKVINKKEKYIIELLKRLPFEDLSQEEQEKVIIEGIF